MQRINLKPKILNFGLLVAAALLLNSPSSAQELENTSWQLVAIHGFNDSVFTPRNPESYLLRFRLENRLQIEADCNQAGASWALDGEALSVTGLVTTRKLCVAPSLFNRYIMNIERATSLSLRGETLIVRTASESDWMEFEPYIFVPGG
ncbi:MAG: META domain-containing protein [Gammaproteobacteria bacterium]